jgi:Flp pilus assembly protein TadG
MIRNWFTRAAKGNVSVEFALITALFVLPLLLGASDFVSIIAAQAQLNTALQALYYYGVSNPNFATTTGTGAYATQIINLINTNSNYQITLATPSMTYACFSTTTTAGTVSTPSAPNASNTANGCSASGQTTLSYANYSISTKVSLPVPLPGFSNPMPMSASGYVQISTTNTP